MHTIEVFHPDRLEELGALWNVSLHPDYKTDRRLIEQNTLYDPNYRPDGSLMAIADGKLIGWALGRLAHVPIGDRRLHEGQAWISAFMVHPEYRRRGIGAELYQRLEQWMRAEAERAHGCPLRDVLVGGDPGHFFPGVPSEHPEAMAFFQTRGFEILSSPIDLWRDMAGYQTPPQVGQALREANAEVVCPDDRWLDSLRDFLLRVFPGRWTYTTNRRIAVGDLPDILVLVMNQRVEGFCQIFHPGSKWLGPAAFWRRPLGPHYGGLGPMGVSEELRGRGLGLALLCKSLERLIALGVERVGIDWVGPKDFYAKVGFQPWKTYHHMGLNAQS